jgi:hypothetical protein
MVVTFLPYPNFKKSIETLDNTRCAKQRLEAYQLINAIMKKRNDPEGKVAWINHPACQMWIGYENALIEYYNTCLKVWEERGKKNTMKPFDYIDDCKVKMPWWVGWYEFHESHKASLLRKHPYYYSKLFTVHEYFQNRGYVWPSHHNEFQKIKLEMYPRQGFDSINLLNRNHYSIHSVNNSVIKNITENNSESGENKEIKESKCSVSSYVIREYDESICKRNKYCVKYKIFAEINKDTMKSSEKSKYLLYTMPELKELCKNKLSGKMYDQIKKYKKTELFDYCEKNSIISV